MTNDDIDIPEDFDKDISEKPTLKEAWEGNPLLKVAAVVLGAVVLIGGYTILFSKDDDTTSKSQVSITGSDRTKVIPGQDNLDAVYTKALEEANKKAAEAARLSGESVLPTPIGTPKGGGLDIPTMPEPPQSDALSEWRKATERNRMRSAVDLIEEEGGPPPPEVVPMVQPIRPQQQVMQQDPKAIQRLADQMRVIISAQAPPESQELPITMEDSFYVAQKKAEEEAERLAELASVPPVDAAGVPLSTDPVRTIVPAGSIAYAQLLTELNSDIEGPVLAQVLSGPFAGGRAIGEVEVKGEYMVITFTRVVKDTVSYAMNGIALDENTTLAGQATDVDHHYFTRIILPAAAKFIEGYGSALAQTGTTVQQTEGGSQAAEQPEPDAKESLYKGFEESASKVSEILDKGSERPITVKIAKGTTMGVFFVDTVTTEDADR